MKNRYTLAIITIIFIYLFTGCTGRPGRSTPAPTVTKPLKSPVKTAGAPSPTPKTSPTKTATPSPKESPSPSPTPEASPGPSPTKDQSPLAMGRRYLEQGNYRQAMPKFDKAISKNPKNAMAYAYRGRAYFEMQDYTRAGSDLKRALELNPKNLQANMFMGNLLSKKYDPAASGYYSKVINEDPDNAEAYYRRALSNLTGDKNEEALKDLKKAVKADPKGEYGKLAKEKLEEMK